MPFFDLPWLLALAPMAGIALAVAWLYALRRRAARLSRLGATQLVARLAPSAAVRAASGRALLLGTSAVLAMIALAGPRWGSESEVVHENGLDVVLAMDASLSMLATDVRPDRLTKMREEARRFVAAANGNRIGLLAFAGRSYILTPLTVDQGALELFLDNLDPSIVGHAGTSLARTIRQGRDVLLATETGSDRALVVMTDGESFDPPGEVESAARKAAESGITLIMVGFGTVGGSTIPLRTAMGTSLKHDAHGQIVVTRYTPEILRSAADAARGVFISAGSTDKANQIRAALSTLRREGRRADRGADRHPRFQLFLLPALLLLLVDTVLAERRGKVDRASPAIPPRPVAVAVLLLVIATPRSMRADDRGDGERLYQAGRFREAAAAFARAIERHGSVPELVYDLGLALLRAGRTEEAAQQLERAAVTTDPSLRYRAMFNLGLAQLQHGLSSPGASSSEELTAAVESYRRVLELNPDDADAKWNYELANRVRKQRGGDKSDSSSGGNSPNPMPKNSPSPPRPSGAMDAERADQLLNSAAREEREVQARRQREARAAEPPGEKDW